jgi:hypothetical protein
MEQRTASRRAEMTEQGYCRALMGSLPYKLGIAQMPPQGYPHGNEHLESRTKAANLPPAIDSLLATILPAEFYAKLHVGEPDLAWIMWPELNQALIVDHASWRAGTRSASYRVIRRSELDTLSADMRSQELVDLCRGANDR